MRYRADIDGLQAVAVLPVGLFHAGFAAFRCGYIGVDVFFVISGNLITRIIAREVRDFDSLRDSDRFIRVRPSQALCRQGKYASYLDGQPLYLDDQHLSVAGSLLLQSLFEAAMRAHK